MVNTLEHNYPEFRPNVIFNGTGILHDSNLKPETTIKQINTSGYRQIFDTNVLGNLLAVRYFLGELADRKAEHGVFTTLSARVGSISENTAGGWYSYRCSKAAVNMLVNDKASNIALWRVKTTCWVHYLYGICSFDIATSVHTD